MFRDNPVHCQQAADYLRPGFDGHEKESEAFFRARQIAKDMKWLNEQGITVEA